MAKRKTEARKEREAAKSAKPKTLDELLAPKNDYERLVAEHVRGRHDAALEAAIVEHQRSVQKCLAYVAGMAQQKAHGANCVMMTEEEVYGLAVQWFLDGDTPIETDAGASVEPASQPADAPASKEAPKEEAPPKKPAKKTAKKPEKAKAEKKDDRQMFFDFGPDVAEEASV